MTATVRRCWLSEGGESRRRFRCKETIKCVMSVGSRGVECVEEFKYTNCKVANDH